MEDQISRRSGFAGDDNKETSTSTPVYDNSPTTTYISLGVCAGLVLIIAFLLFCLLSKRDLSPCPRRSDFGRRYSQVRKRLSRTWTIGTSG